MAIVERRFEPEPVSEPNGGVVGRLARLARLELELGYAEARRVALAALVAVAVAVAATIALIASIVVLLAGALAVLLGARWEHLVASGGGVFILAAAALAWSVYRLRTLTWPREVLTSIEENWQWLGAQLRSRLTLR
jgi:putative superfamily III holin-X